VQRQPSLFDRGEPRFDPRFSGIRRVALDAEAWIDELPGWLRGHERLFDELARTARWRAERRHMYDHVVDVPRLLASVPEEASHPVIEQMRAARDLLVMGGTCQRTWRHAVPKVSSADPRLAIQFRPAWFARARY
jgi:alkylated DNA repair dioxygenase AlkB